MRIWEVRKLCQMNKRKGRHRYGKSLKVEYLGPLGQGTSGDFSGPGFQLQVMTVAQIHHQRVSSIRNILFKKERGYGIPL